MKAVAQSPPVTQPEDKHHWFKKVLMFFLPQRFHKYLTPEVFVAWNVSSYVTLAQVAVVTKWKLISGWVTTVAVPTVTKFVDDVWNGMRALAELVSVST